MTDLTAAQLREQAVPWQPTEHAARGVGDRVIITTEVYHIQEGAVRVAEVVARNGRPCTVTEQAYHRTRTLQPGTSIEFDAGWLVDGGNVMWEEFVCAHVMPPTQHQLSEEDKAVLAARSIVVSVGGVEFTVRIGSAFVACPADKSVPIIIKNTGTAPAVITLMATPK